MVVLGALERNGDRVHPRIEEAMKGIDGLHITLVGRDAVFVHVMDGKHKKGSRHYVGLAVDIRIWYVKNPQVFADSIKKLLGKHYDVVLEKTHIHVEYDPKYPSL